MELVDIEQQINDINEQITQSEREKTDLVAQLNNLKKLKNDISDLSQKDSELPPGFTIDYFHRNDTLESVYALYLHGKYYDMASAKLGYNDQKNELRKQAWSAYDFACKILPNTKTSCIHNYIDIGGGHDIGGTEYQCSKCGDVYNDWSMCGF